MRLAHLADLHVGFRQFERAGAGGRNQRELDVEAAVRAAVDGVIAAAPDLVLIAGDIFHHVRPPNGALLFFFGEVQRLRAALPGAPLLIVAGNHDTPRSVDSGSILPLLARAGAHVVAERPETVLVPGAAVHCVPSAWAAKPPPAPASDERRHILLLHGDVPGFGAPAPPEAVDVAALGAQGWSYVALGHYHSAAEVWRGAGSAMWYAGSVEFTSSNPWAEIAQGPKGWLLVDLSGAAPEVVHQPVPTRRFLDLPPIDASGLGAAQVDAALAARFEEFDVAGAVARLVVLGVGAATRRALDHAALRRWQGRALSLRAELRRPEAETSTPARRAALRQSLDERVRAFLEERELPPDLSRPDFVELGLQTFRDADDAAQG